MQDEKAMRYWIAQAAKQRRLRAKRLLVHVGASASRDQSTIYRFEEGGAWPRDADGIVSAYADDLEIHPIELWADAIELWRADLTQSRKDPAQAFAADAEEASQPPTGRARPTGRRARAECGQEEAQ
jgi:hypothetical protein